MKKLMAAMLSFVMAMMLLAGCASASTDNTFSDPMPVSYTHLTLPTILRV